MTTLVTRAGKGSALTHDEVDANFTGLDAADTAEAATRAAAITTEASARASADTTLASSVTTEASARASADTTLAASVTSEASARAAADTAIALGANYFKKVINLTGQQLVDWWALSPGSGQSPKEFLPAPGANKVNHPVRASFQWKKQSCTLDVSGSFLTMRPGSTSGPALYSSAFHIDAAASQYWAESFSDPGDDQVVFANQPLNGYLDSAAITSDITPDGNYRITIYYLIDDLA